MLLSSTQSHISQRITKIKRLLIKSGNILKSSEWHKRLSVTTFSQVKLKKYGIKVMGFLLLKMPEDERYVSKVLCILSHCINNDNVWLDDSVFISHKHYTVRFVLHI